MQFSKQGSSSFTPYQGPKSVAHSNQDMHLVNFSRLSLNSPRSNASLYPPNIPVLQYDDDRFTMGTKRKRKGSASFQWKQSSFRQNTFLGKSLIGKSSLYRDNDFLNFHELDSQQNMGRDQLSEKSCPVGYDESHIQKFQHPEETFEKEKGRKRFEKTKNLLRTISTYFHKYIKYNKKAKEMVFKYLKKQNEEIGEQRCEQYHRSLIDWVCSLNMINFQQYQKIWVNECEYRSIYRQLCYKYYKQQAYCDIQNSRLTTKYITYQYLHQFIEGLMSPNSFTQFKNE